MPEDETPNVEENKEEKPEATPAPESDGAVNKVTTVMDKQMGTINALFTTQMMVLGMALALILMLFGALMINMSTITDTATDPADRQDDSDDARGGARNGAMVYNLGLVILIAMLFGGAMLNPDLDPQARMGMFIAAGFIAFGGFDRRGGY